MRKTWGIEPCVATMRSAGGYMDETNECIAVTTERAFRVISPRVASDARPLWRA